MTKTCSRKLARITALLLSGPFLAGFALPGRASADEMQSVYAEILRNPKDVALSLRYAQLAEAAGQPRKALTAYERVLLNDPSNREAKSGLQRIRRHLQPDSTAIVAEFGIAFDDNPRHVPSGENAEAQAFGRVAINDERHLGTVMWRTSALLHGVWHGEAKDLDYGFAGLETGPLLDAIPGFTLHPLIGAGVASLDGRHYYSQATVGLGLEGVFNGAYQVTRLRAGYRSFDDHFASDEGWFADLSGRYTLPHLLASPGTLVVSPALRWSGIDGTGFDIDGDEVEPGRYTEAGLKAEYFLPVADKVTLGTSIRVGERFYAFDTAFPSGDLRQDVTVEPGASVIFRNLFAIRNDLRLDYTYRWSDSNDDGHDYVEQRARLSVVTRF